MCTPFSRATGLSAASFSSEVSRSPSSFATWCVVSFGLPSSSTSGASISTIEPANRSSFHARIACSCDARPNRSVSSRVMPHFSAMRSAPSNCDVISYCEKYELRDRAAEPEVAAAVRPDRHAAHHLDAAPDGDVDHARADQRRREVGRLLRRPALRVDRGRGHRQRQAGRQPRRAPDVEALLADLAHAAGDHLADRPRDRRPSARRAPPARSPAGRRDGRSTGRRHGGRRGCGRLRRSRLRSCDRAYRRLSASTQATERHALPAATHPGDRSEDEEQQRPRRRTPRRSTTS